MPASAAGRGLFSRLLLSLGLAASVTAATAAVSAPPPALAPDSPWMAYGSALGQHLQALVSADETLHKQAFQTVVRVWISADGRISRLQLKDSTAPAEVNRRLEAVILHGPPLQPPPPDMPQPVSLRINSALQA